MDDYNIEMLAEQHWEETIDFLTQDMPADEIDIAVLAERYREYLDELQEYDLSVPARAIRVCAALLNLKAAVTLDYEDELEEEEPENPMDFEDEELLEEEEDDEPDLETPPDLEMPVRPKPKRRMQKSELKDALRDALEVKERREERQEEREQIDEQFEFEEDTLQDKINSLYSRLTDMVRSGSSSTKKKVKFDQLLDEKTSEEKIEKFMHVLNLENDKKVTCEQEEFLGELHVKPEEEEKETEEAESSDEKYIAN